MVADLRSDTQHDASPVAPRPSIIYDAQSNIPNLEMCGMQNEYLQEEIYCLALHRLSAAEPVGRMWETNSFRDKKDRISATQNENMEL